MQAPAEASVPRFVFTAALPNAWAAAGGVDWFVEIVLPPNATAYTAGLGLAAGTSFAADGTVHLLVPPGGAAQPQSVIVMPAAQA